MRGEPECPDHEERARDRQHRRSRTRSLGEQRPGQREQRERAEHVAPHSLEVLGGERRQPDREQRVRAVRGAEPARDEGNRDERDGGDDRLHQDAGAVAGVDTVEQLPAEPDLEPGVRPLGLVPGFLDRRVDERVVEARPQPHRPRDQARRRNQHTQVAELEHAQVQPGRDPELGRDAARLIRPASRQPAPSFDRAQQQADGHRDPDRARRGRARAGEPGQQRLIGFEEHERADREREEQRVGVARAVEEPAVRIEREAGDGEQRGAARRGARAHQCAKSISVARPATQVTTISASGVLSIARASGRATSG